MDYIKTLRQENKLIFLILLFSLVVKGVIAYSVTVPNFDAIKYINAARSFSVGNFKEGFHFYYLPLYPLFLSCVHFFIHDWLRAAQLLSWIPLVLAAIPLYHITKKLFGKKAALWSITAYSLAPSFNNYSGQVLRDPLAILLFSLAVLTAMKAFDSDGVKDFFLVLFLSILLVLTRIETIFFFPFFFLVFLAFLVLDPHKRNSELKRTCFLIIVPLTIFFILLVAVSYEVGLFANFKSLHGDIRAVLEGRFFNKYQQLYRKLSSLSTPYTGNLFETTKHYMPLIYLVALMEGGAKILFPTNLVPLFLKKHKKYTKNHYFILGIILLFAGVTYLHLIYGNVLSRRYLIIPVFFLFPWVGRGLEMVYNLTAACKKGKNIVIGCFLFFFLLIPAGKTFTHIGDKNLILKEAGKWTHSYLEGKQNILLAGNDVRIPYLINSQNKFIFCEPLRHIEKYAYKHKADLMIVIFSPKKRKRLPAIKKYRIIKKFHDQKRIVIIAEKKK